MSLIYVTGAPGVGKSTVRTALLNMGYDTRDIDDSAYGGPYSIATGEKVVIPPAEQRSDDWFSLHEWRVHSDAFESLREEARSKDIIVCGVAETDADILQYFDSIIYLQLSIDELKKRLSTRTGNDYGKNEQELKMIIDRKRRLDRRYRDISHTVVHAAGSPQDTIMRILAVIQTR